MRALAILAIATMLLASQAAAECPTPALTDAFAPAPECPAYVECGAALCACAGASGSNADECLVNAETGCNATEACVAEYVHCLYELGNIAVADAECNATVTGIHNSGMLAVIGGFIGSDFQLSCQRRVCSVLNTTNCGEPEHDPCHAPVQETVAPQFLIKATIRLSGSHWAEILNDPVARMALETALKEDIAAFLGVDASDIVIITMEVGSLIVQFGVVEGAGVSTESLLEKLATAGDSSSWLTSTKAVYAAVSDEEIEVLEVTVDEADGEPVTPPTPEPEDEPEGPGASPSSAAAFAVVSTVAAAAIVAFAA